MNKVYLVVGVPGSGKSWVCSQLRDRFNYIPHDNYIGFDYKNALATGSKLGAKPVLAETPFSVSQIKDPLERTGCPVETVFILEDYNVVLDRYKAREGKAPAPGDRTRQETYRKRAEESGSFSGTSQQVLDYLKGKV